MITLLSPKKQQQEGLLALDTILKRHGAIMSREEKWGEKRLYHPIKDVTKGQFVYKQCKIKPELVKELVRDLRLDAHILRFMLKKIA